MRIAALRINIDSIQGYREGLPPLLDALEAAGAGASVFFAMGTEHDGSMLGFFREEKEIVASAPGIIRDTYRRGFDCGICGWNPREWALRLDKIKDTTLVAEMKRAVREFMQRTGVRPSGFAAPGYRVNYLSLRIQDDVGFIYSSDTFGSYPYLPKISWKTFQTPQIPATLPPLDVVVAKASAEAVRERIGSLLGSLPAGLSVLPMNASVGTMPEVVDSLRATLRRGADEGVRSITLRRAIEGLPADKLPICEIKSVHAFGLQREVALQVLD